MNQLEIKDKTIKYETIKKILDNWLISFSSVDNQTFFNQFLLKLNQINYQPLIILFTNRLNPLLPFIQNKNDQNKLKNIITSGAGCFYASIIMSFTQIGYVNNIEELFNLSTFYMVIDHILDDKTINDDFKKVIISEIKSYINNKNNNKNNKNPEIKYIVNRYQDIINKIPNTKYYLDKLFESEATSSIYQKNPNLSENEYLKIAEEKGGKTCEAIQSILGLDITYDEYELGACIQLIDDLFDINDDINDDINTISTYILKRDGDLDYLFKYTVNRIYKMNNKYNIFKVVLLAWSIFSIQINNDKYSTELIKITEEYVPTILKNIKTKDEIRDIFYNFLSI